jgi:hypothetical protein
MQVSLVALPSVALTYRYCRDFTFTAYDSAIQPVTITVRSFPTPLS